MLIFSRQRIKKLGFSTPTGSGPVLVVTVPASVELATELAMGKAADELDLILRAFEPWQQPAVCEILTDVVMLVLNREITH